MAGMALWTQQGDRCFGIKQILCFVIGIVGSLIMYAFF
jgi:hypothetical protein